METLPIVLAIAVTIHLIKRHYDKKDDEQIAEDLVLKQRKEMADLIENREERQSTMEFNEDAFWSLINETRKKSGDNYKNHLGLLTDKFVALEESEIIELDNLLVRLYVTNYSYDLSAASYIIFKADDVQAMHVLMTVFLLKGQVFFKQACLNPNLIIGKEMNEIDGRVIFDITAAAYSRKTDKLIPLLPEQEIPKPLKGEPWKEKDLPSRFSELWMHFA